MVEDGLVRFMHRLGNKGAKKGEEQELYKLPKGEVSTPLSRYCSAGRRQMLRIVRLKQGRLKKIATDFFIVLSE